MALLKQVRVNFDIAGQGFLQLSEGYFHLFSEFYSAGSRLFLHGQNHGGFAVYTGIAPFDGPAKFDLRNLR